MKALLLLLLIYCFLGSCYRPWGSRSYNGKVSGYKPVYSQDPELKKIKFMASRVMKNPGKIYVRNNMILQNDIGNGIHLYNKSIPSDVKKMGFINIPGNVELSLKGNFIYANSFSDLVVIDIGNWLDLKEVKRVPEAFLSSVQYGTNPYIPLPDDEIYYECLDYSKGTHIGWEKDSLTNYCIYYH